MKKKKTVSKKMPSKKYIINRLDEIFANKVKSRDKFTCVRCGKVHGELYTINGRLKKAQVQCSHVIGKRYKALRWDLNNAKTLCFGCHKFWWHAPSTQYQAALWFQKTFPTRSKRIIQVYEMDIAEPTRKELYEKLMLWL